MRNLLIVSALILTSGACKKSSDGNTDSSNRWEARYRMEGTMSDAVNATYTWPGNTYEYSLEAVTSTQLKLVSKDLTIVGHLMSAGGSLSYYSQFGLLVNFDPATNKITSISNFYGQPSGSGRSAVLDPSGVNSWDPSTKNIKIKYWMDETGVTGHRVAFDETWVYLGPR